MSYYPLSDEERLIRDTVREFARERVAPRAAAIDRTGEFPWDLVREMGKMGLLGVCLPEEYGGAGQSYVLFAMIVEELCKACATTGLIMDVNISLCAEPIVLFGNEEQKKRFLTPLASGEKLGALAITEPEAASALPPRPWASRSPPSTTRWPTSRSASSSASGSPTSKPFSSWSPIWPRRSRRRACSRCRRRRCGSRRSPARANPAWPSSSPA